jgi:hypothetical protein
VPRTSTILHAKPNQIKICIFPSPFLNGFNFFSLSDSGRNAPLEDTRRDGTFVGDSGDAGGVDASSAAAANPAGKGEVPAKDDDATAAVLPPVSSEEAANSTQESGGKAIAPTNHF